MKSSKTSLFLMELIIAILFFSISSAVCIQLFVKSHLLDQKTQEENRLLITCQNLNEIYLGILPELYDSEPVLLKEKIISILKEDIQMKNVCLLSANGFPDYFNQPVSDSIFSIPLFYGANGKPTSFENSTTAIVFYFQGCDELNNYHASTYAFHIELNEQGKKQSNEIYHVDLIKHIPERIQ